MSIPTSSDAKSTRKYLWRKSKNRTNKRINSTTLADVNVKNIEILPESNKAMRTCIIDIIVQAKETIVCIGLLRFFI